MPLSGGVPLLVAGGARSPRADCGGIRYGAATGVAVGGTVGVVDMDDAGLAVEVVEPRIIELSTSASPLICAA